MKCKFLWRNDMNMWHMERCVCVLFVSRCVCVCVCIWVDACSCLLPINVRKTFCFNEAYFSLHFQLLDINHLPTVWSNVGFVSAVYALTFIIILFNAIFCSCQFNVDCSIFDFMDFARKKALFACGSSAKRTKQFPGNTSLCTLLLKDEANTYSILYVESSEPN